MKKNIYIFLVKKRNIPPFNTNSLSASASTSTSKGVTQKTCMHLVFFFLKKSRAPPLVLVFFFPKKSRSCPRVLGFLFFLFENESVRPAIEEGDRRSHREYFCPCVLGFLSEERDQRSRRDLRLNRWKVMTRTIDRENRGRKKMMREIRLDLSLKKRSDLSRPYVRS